MVICKVCQKGIIYSHAHIHIIQHGYSGATVEEIQNAFAESPIPLCSGLKDERVTTYFQDLKKIHKVIPYLEVYDGLQCGECGYACVVKSGMRAHYSYHQHKFFDGQQRWTAAKLQSLFHNTVAQFKYFSVEGKD